jgi:hypothetical protein
MEPVLLDARRPLRTGQCLRFLLGAQANVPSSSGDGRLLLHFVFPLRRAEAIEDESYSFFILY